MKSIIFSIFLSCAVHCVQAQTITLKQLEASFLKNNLQLIADKFSIDKAEALIVQEKLWQNPTLSISEVNLWKTYNIEEQPHLFANYGKAQQIAIELEQVIETAGKRKKRVVIKQLEQENAVLAYEELLRELKKELRLGYYTLNRIVLEEAPLLETVKLFTEMSEQYERQAQLYNVSQADYLRIQAELLSLQKDLISLENEKFDKLNVLRILCHQPQLQAEDILFATDVNQYLHNIPADITETAKQQNIGIRLQYNEIQIATAQFQLERAQRTPNIAVQMNYDRGGNIMSDFIGLGLSVDLPFFNKNKGNIKAAQIDMQQQQMKQKSIDHQLENYVSNLTEQLQRLNSSLQKWPKKQLEQQAIMLENYKKHLQSKQISLIEFIDFNKAYREGQQAYYELLETYNSTFEELQYIAGQDF